MATRASLAARCQSIRSAFVRFCWPHSNLQTIEKCTQLLHRVALMEGARGRLHRHSRCRRLDDIRAFDRPHEEAFHGGGQASPPCLSDRDLRRKEFGGGGAREHRTYQSVCRSHPLDQTWHGLVDQIDRETAPLFYAEESVQATSTHVVITLVDLLHDLCRSIRSPDTRRDQLF